MSLSTKLQRPGVFVPGESPQHPLDRIPDSSKAKNAASDVQ